MFLNHLGLLSGPINTLDAQKKFHRSWSSCLISLPYPCSDVIHRQNIYGPESDK